MTSWDGIITADPEILVGKPVIAGTRVSVELVLERLANGDSEAEIAEHYDVTRDQIRACLAYAAAALSQVEVYNAPLARRA
jgi:uncharacterized protein (DUF433 family)